MTIPKIKYWTPIWLSTARFFGVVRSRCALQRLITRLAEELGSEEAAWRYVMDSRMDPGVEGGEPGFGYRLRHRGKRLEEWLEEQAAEQKSA